MTDDTDIALLTIVKGASIVFSGFIIGYTVSFITKLIIARMLDTSGYGWIAIGIMILNFGTVFSLLGLESGLARYLPRLRSNEERKGVIISALHISLPFSILFALILLFFSEEIALRLFHDAGLSNIIEVFSLTIPLSVLINIIVNTFRGMKDAKVNVLLNNIILPVGRLVSVVFFLFLGFDALGVACGYLFSLIIGVIGGIYLFSRSPLTLNVKPIYMHKELFLFSAPLIMSGSMQFIITNTDTFMLGLLLSSSQVGIYSVGYTMARMLLIFLSSIGFLFMPVFSELHSKGEDLRRIYRVVSKWIFALTIPFFLIIFLFPSESIAVTFGEKYIAGSKALTVLALAFFIHSVLGANGITLVALGETKYVMKVVSLSAALNIILNYVLIQIYGILGAAVATGFSFVVMNILYSSRLYRLEGISPISTSMLRPGIFSILFIIFFYSIVKFFFTPNLLILIIFFIVFLLSYICCFLYFGGVEKEDVLLINSVEKKMGVNLTLLKGFARRFMK